MNEKIKNIVIVQIAVILSAIFTSFSATPLDLFPLVWFTFIPILFIMEKVTTPKIALFLGLEMGFLINLHSFYWLKETIIVFGGVHWSLAVFLYMLLSLAQSLRYAVFFYIYKKFKLINKNFFIFPILYILLEHFFPMLFNWTMGNTQYKFLPFIQITDIFGIIFLSFVIATFNFTIYKIWYNYRIEKVLNLKPLAYIIVFLSLILVYGLVQINRYDNLMAKADHIRIGVVQANIPIFEHTDPRKYKKNLSKFENESLKLQEQNVDLILWPESSHYQSERWDVKDLRHVAPKLRTPLIFGGITYKREKGEKRSRLYNTAFFTDENGILIDYYNKHYLLAFGEYMPLREYFPNFRKYFDSVGNFYPGIKTKVFQYKSKNKSIKAKIGVMVCYEDILEAFSNRINTQNPNILINMTNDAWFGDSSEPDLHKMIALFRTLENRVPLIRSTNTGRTVFIDVNGRLGKSLPLLVTGSIYDDVPIMKTKTLYQSFGYLMPYIFIIIFILLILFERKKIKKEE